MTEITDKRRWEVVRFIMTLHSSLLASVVAKSAQEQLLVRIETPQGTVVYKELSRDKNGRIAQLLREVSARELESLTEDASQAPAFIAKYAPEDRRSSHALDELDHAFTGWLRSTDPAKEPKERVIRILGSAYGFYCIEYLGVRWAWIKDDFGEDIALVRENPTTQGFPFSSIQYRIEDKKVDFIYALYASLEHLIMEAMPKADRSKLPAPSGK